MPKRTVRTISYLLSPISYLLSATLAAAAPQAIRFTEARTAPPPARMAANVAIVKDSSLSRRIEADIVKVTGPKAPLTYSGDLPGPYPGFNWFVSRHYAILSDMDDKDVRDALVLLELAWPHYVLTFQWRPPASDTHRQAIVFASSRSVLEDCLLHDSIHAKLRGGLTLEGFGCAYLYAGAPYQTRYILLHEGTHLYQYSLSGDTRGCYGFLREGIADYISSHIYDPDDRTLTVNVLDRAPIHNHLVEGLADWERLGRPGFSALFDNPSPSRGLSVLMTAFLQRTPEAAAKWRLFCERIVRDMAQKDAKRTTLAALRDLYGEPKTLDAPFAKWMVSLKPTFNLIDRDFDQSAPNAFVALPPSNAMARLAIELDAQVESRMSNVESLADLPTAKSSNCQTNPAELRIDMSRPKGTGASAGFSFLGQTFSMSNTWSGGCVYTFSNGTETKTAEVPVAFMRRHDDAVPFIIKLTQTPEKCSVEVRDSSYEPFAQPLDIRPYKDAHLRNTHTLELFATDSPVKFVVRDDFLQLPSCSFEADPEFPSPEIAFPSFAEAVTDWKFIGPFTAAEAPKTDAIPADDANLWAEDGTRLRWQHVAAHSATPITPPLVNLNEVFRRQGNGLVAYAKTVIESETDNTVSIILGVADGAEVFLNDEKVAERKGKREWADGNLRIENVKLRKGRNRLILKLSHVDSTWLLAARLQRTGDN